MPDIFDEVAASVPAHGGDIFDQVATETAQGGLIAPDLPPEGGGSLPPEYQNSIPTAAPASVPVPPWYKGIVDTLSTGRSGTQLDQAEIRKDPSALTDPLIKIPPIPADANDNERQKLEKAIGNLGRGVISSATSPFGAEAFANPVVGLGTLAVQAPELYKMERAAEKTPPFSPERNAAAVNIGAYLATLGHMTKPGATPEVAPERPVSPASASEAAPAAIVPEAPVNPELGAPLPPKAVDATLPPDEQTGRVAASPASTTSGDLSGQQPTGSAGPVGDVGARPGVGEAGAEQRYPAGTSNRVNAEVYGEGAVPSGEGVDTLQLLDNGRRDIRSGAVDPYSILSRTRARGIANPEEYAALAAEHERLVNDAVAKQKANAPDAPVAAQRAEDFANAIQPHKTAASDLMRLFQGDLNYDMSTPFGMDQYMKSEIGRTPTAAERPAFDRMSSDIGRAQTEVAGAVDRANVRVRNRYAKVRDIPIEEAAARVKEWLKDCQV